MRGRQRRGDEGGVKRGGENDEEGIKTKEGRVFVFEVSFVLMQPKINCFQIWMTWNWELKMPCKEEILVP